VKRAIRELPELSYETVTPPFLFWAVTAATCKIKMNTERQKIYRRVPAEIVIAHFNDKLTVYVNAGIASCSGSSSEGRPTSCSCAVEQIFKITGILMDAHKYIR
jgi:hypothetical protein